MPIDRGTEQGDFARPCSIGGLSFSPDRRGLIGGATAGGHVCSTAVSRHFVPICTQLRGGRSSGRITVTTYTDMTTRAGRVSPYTSGHPRIGSSKDPQDNQGGDR